MAKNDRGEEENFGENGNGIDESLFAPALAPQPPRIAANR